MSQGRMNNWLEGIKPMVSAYLPGGTKKKTYEKMRKAGLPAEILVGDHDGVLIINLLEPEFYI